MAKPFWRADRKAWYFKLKNADGTWTTRKGGDTLQQARTVQVAAERELQPVRLKLQTPDQFKLAQKRSRPIAEAVGEFEAWMNKRRVTAHHVNITMAGIRAVLDEAAITTMHDMQTARIEAAVDDIGAGKTANTRNRYLASVKQFCRWATKRGWMATDPTESIEKLKEVEHPRRSRALTQDEVARLLAAVPDRYRRLYYLIAFRMGLRWSEIRALRWVDINTNTGWLTLQAKDTKARRADDLPIPSDVLAELRQITSFRLNVFDSTPTLTTWKRDLQRAGIKYSDPAGQADRKCARMTFVTHLAMAGVDMRTAQQLARHTDINLTANVYTDPRMLDMAGEVERIVPKAEGDETKKGGA